MRETAGEMKERRRSHFHPCKVKTEDWLHSAPDQNTKGRLFTNVYGLNCPLKNDIHIEKDWMGRGKSMRVEWNDSIFPPHS